MGTILIVLGLVWILFVLTRFVQAIGAAGVVGYVIALPIALVFLALGAAVIALGLWLL